jgi:hypothetical protein
MVSSGFVQLTWLSSNKWSLFFYCCAGWGYVVAINAVLEKLPSSSQFPQRSEFHYLKIGLEVYSILCGMNRGKRWDYETLTGGILLKEHPAHSLAPDVGSKLVLGPNIKWIPFLDYRNYYHLLFSFIQYINLNLNINNEYQLICN